MATSFATSGIGSALGLSAGAGSILGAGVGTGAASAGTAFIGGAGTAVGGTGATAAGLTGMGSMLAAAAGPLAVAAVADFASRMLAGDKLVGGGIGKVLNFVPVIGPLINALFGRGPYKPIGPEELVGQFSESGFAGDLLHGLLLRRRKRFKNTSFGNGSIP